jgi:hypothetical protein
MQCTRGKNKNKNYRYMQTLATVLSDIKTFNDPNRG